MTARSQSPVKAPLFGTIAILVAGLTLLVATGPALAVERDGARLSASSSNPPADPRGAHAS